MSGGDDESEVGPDWVEAQEEATAVERALDDPPLSPPRSAPSPWIEVTPAPSSGEEPSPAASFQIGAPVTVQRRVHPGGSSTSSHRAPRPPSPDRAYPKMRALLGDPHTVPYGNSAPRPPPVPGTFFPAPRAPLPKPAPTDLDTLLQTMADGLMIGESPTGHTEVRVTLKDEFFAGTELRIQVGEGEVEATLLPPDREIYWQLNANADALRSRLEERGLRVTKVTVVEPK